ncbi:DUF2304 domain-containing protein [Candidatus Saccharibacteria bacterium]|nr:DUF2304 domain-containing protein [Candidatus Saccharibacteria bacterium]
MIIIQLIVVVLALAVAVATLGSRRTHTGKAWKKIALVLLALAMIVGVLFPEVSNNMARIVGVGRGADLLLYGTVMAFVLYVLNSYLRQQDQQNITFELARKIAINEANIRYSIK